MDNDYNVNVSAIKVDPVIPADYDNGLTVAKLITNNSTLKHRDIVVVTSKVVSLLEGRFVNIKDVKPSIYSKVIGEAFKVKPEIVELVRSEGKINLVLPIDKFFKNKKVEEVLYEQNQEGITKDEINEIKDRYSSVFVVDKFGFKADSAGIDMSNLPEGYRVLLPEDPGKSAEKIAKDIKDLAQVDVAVIITDTLGSRTGFMGNWDIPIGFYGIDPLERKGGARDIFGKLSTGGKANYVFPLAAMAGAVMGNCDECTPIAVFSGYRYLDPPVGKTLMNTKDISIPKKVLTQSFIMIAIETIKFYFHSFRASIIAKVS